MKKIAPSDELGKALHAIESVWMEGAARLDPLPGKPEQQVTLSSLLDDVLKVQNFALTLCKGDLAQQLHAKGLIAGSLKSLQANLRHLSWQTQMVAKGDFSQRVYFLGEFSESFNLMISRLAEARDQIKRREEELLHVNANLEAHNQEITLINKLSEALQTCLTWEDAYPIIGHFVQELFPKTTGVLFLQDSDQQLVKMVASWGTSLIGSQEVIPHDCWAVRHGLVYFGEGHEEGPPCCQLPSQSVDFFACLPLQAQGNTMGLLRLKAQGAIPPGGFEQLQVLARMIRDHLSLALANIRLRETLQHQAIHDPLTDLFNRRYLEETLGREILRAQRKEVALVVMMLDLDHFKKFNDTCGHEAGDHLLQLLADFLKSNIRGGDIACRYGGEEFVLILPETSLDVALLRAEEVRRGVSHLKLSYRGQTIRNITISLGVATFPKHGTNTDDLLKAADKALYRAKAEGRNRVMVADSSEESVP